MNIRESDKLFVISVSNFMLDESGKLDIEVCEFREYMQDCNRRELIEFMIDLLRGITYVGDFAIISSEGTLFVFSVDKVKLSKVAAVIEEIWEHGCNLLEVINAAIDISSLNGATNG